MSLEDIKVQVWLGSLLTIGLILVMVSSTEVEGRKMTYPLLMPHVRPTVVSVSTSYVK